MRILVCALEAPLPPVNGFRLALSALLDQLRDRHHVRVVAFRAPDQPRDDPMPELRLLELPSRTRPRDVLEVAAAVARRRPFGVDRLAAGMESALQEELQRFGPDVVHVTSGRIAALAPALGGRPSVLAALDAWHLNVEAAADVAGPAKRILLRDEAARVRRFEAAAYEQFGRVVVVSHEDRRALLSLNPKLRVAVIPNGVDADAFSPGAPADREPDLVVFTGVMDYPPNVAAADFLAREVLPLVCARRPSARLAIVGRRPAAPVRELGALPGLQVIGEVADIGDWLRRSHVYACPMTSGTGIKNKLLEAMAAGLPAVATRLALQGLAAEDGRDVLVADTAAEFAVAILRLLEGDDEAQAIGAAARRYVRAHHDWEAVGRAYAALYEEVRSGAG